MITKKQEDIMLAKYPVSKMKSIDRKELLEKVQIKETYTKEEFQKRSDDVLKIELP